MKIKSFNVKMLGALVPVALAFASCSEEKVVVEDPVNPPADQPSQTVPTDVVPAQTFTDVTFPKAAFGGTVTSRASRADAGKVLSTVLEVSSPVKGESATSVFVAEDGTYYVSYQTQGDSVGGGIQTIKGEEVAFYPTEADDKAFDFNSLYFDRARVLGVGHYKKTDSKDGAAVVGFLENNGSSIELSYKNVTTAEGIYSEIIDPENSKGEAHEQLVGYTDAGDANSIVKYYDNYVVATRKGLALLRSDLSRVREKVGEEDSLVYFVNTPGSAKYVVESGNGLTALYLDGTTPCLYDFTSIVGTTDAKGSKIDGAALVKTNGKNMLAYDNGTIYACLGEAGLLVGNDLLTKPFKGETKQLPVAGVAVDDDYIYVADGTYLVILNKADNSVVTKWNLKTDKVDDEGHAIFEEGSINYVVVGDAQADGTRQLVVACGKAGVKVLSFNPAGSAEEEEAE